MDVINNFEVSASAKHLPMKIVSQRYGVVSRTIDRWLLQADICFPRPLIINRRRYWREADLIGWENGRCAPKTGGQ